MPHTVYRYQIAWNGLPAGYCIGEVKPDTKGPKLIVTIESTGIVDLMLNHHSYSELETIWKNGSLVPTLFHSHSTLRKKKKQITIEYSPLGKILSESVIPPDNRASRKAVDEGKKTMFNPLFAAFEVHQHLKQYQASGATTEFSIPIYDGRRLSEYHFKIIGREPLSIRKQEFQTIHFQFTRNLIQGYSPREWRDDKKEKPQVDIWVNDDPELLPIKFAGRLNMGVLDATLSKSCNSREACEPNAKSKP